MILKSDGTPYEELLLPKLGVISLEQFNKIKDTWMTQMKINELRRSCGVEPEPTTVRFRRYEDIEEGGKSA